ncbi:MAG: hypothetical protein TREMPRED_000897 [Tremellales sp. Tagirdzhanova-0007]|nr:MAG: hypothetical protein TREMPRED_000897 [Tremellales sp. Tagirdzhanova-0007]
MLGLKARLNVIDNSGAILAELINVYKVKTKRPKSVGFAAVGDVIKVVVSKARSISDTQSNRSAATSSNVTKVRKGEMQKALVTSCRQAEPRPDGRYVWFDQSSCVLLNNKEEMLGTRISAPVSAHLRDIQGGTGVAGGRWSKVLALAPRVM